MLKFSWEGGSIEQCILNLSGRIDGLKELSVMVREEGRADEQRLLI